MTTSSVVQKIPLEEPSPAVEVQIESENNAASAVAKFRAKLAYTIRNLIARPTYLPALALARFRVLRQIFAYCSQFRASVKIDEQTESLFDLDPAATVDTLQRDGVCEGLNLPPHFLQSLNQYLLAQNCYAGGKSHLGFKISEKEQLDRIYKQPFYVARYFNMSANCPQISRLVNDPKLQQIAAGYIGKQAQYTGASLFWTFPIQGKSVDADQQMFRHFHYDIDDFAGLRFCFYLTDVTLNDGPHVCIQGSHVRKRISHILNFFSRIQTAAELHKTYQADRFMTISGDAGTGFMEDTFCFHKGNPPVSKPRLFLQLHFAANNYSQCQYLDERDPNTLHSWHENLPN